MQSAIALLRFVARSLLDSVGAGLVGEFAIDILPDIAQDVWTWWSAERNEDERRDDLQALIQLPAQELKKLVTMIVAEVAAHQTAEIRQALATYLTQIPASVRHSLRRPSDLTGLTLPAGLPLAKADDLLPLLPTRLPRFKSGDRPLSGVDWELEELLGVGGFGEVWKARNPHLTSSPSVALKFCVDPPAAKVLRHEARLLDRLMLQGKHPGIVTLRQTYLSAEPPCLEYEYVPGGDLTGVILAWHRQKNGPTPQQVARVLQRLAEIVAFAHRLDPPIVHRDLKPANILVQRSTAGKMTLRVADFGNGGVAVSRAIRQTQDGTTKTRLLLSALRGACTPLYASPQQLRGAAADTRDDVFAMGVVWYQLLSGDLTTGRPGGTRWPGRLIERGMDRSLVDLLGSCLEDNPADRPPSAIALSEQLGRILDGTPASGNSVAGMPSRISNSLGMVFTIVPAGDFYMGSPPTESERGSDEGPQRRVKLTRPFYLAVHPVTQQQYHKVMGENPSYFQGIRGGGPDFPVEKTSWHDALAFCRRLSELPDEKRAGRCYRLPTEAEWEYSCRAGSQAAFTFGPSLSASQANFNGNYPYGGANRGRFLETTSRVGAYPPNCWGLHDMHGNVWEWCSDYYEQSYYRKAPPTDPSGPATGTLRVVRGGSCMNIGRFCRSAYRFGVAAENRDLDVGFRVVMTLDGDAWKQP